jgi:hypothetical protein
MDVYQSSWFVAHTVAFCAAAARAAQSSASASALRRESGGRDGARRMLLTAAGASGSGLSAEVCWSRGPLAAGKDGRRAWSQPHVV